MVRLEKKIQTILKELDKKDVFLLEGINFLKGKFSEIFNAVNKILSDRFVNAYAKSLPGIWTKDFISMFVGKVSVSDLEQFAAISSVDKKLKVTNVTVRFRYEVKYKEYSALEHFIDYEFFLTNDLKYKENITSKVSDIINKELYTLLLPLANINESKVKDDNFGKFIDKNDWSIQELMGKYKNKITSYVKKSFEAKFPNVKFSFVNNNFVVNEVYNFPLRTDISDIYEKFYQEQSSKTLEERKKEISPVIENKFKFNDSFVAYITKISLKYVRVYGLQLNDDVVSATDKKELEISVSLSKELLNDNIKNMINWMITFFHHYKFYLTSSEAIFYVNEKFYNELKILTHINAIYNKLSVMFNQTHGNISSKTKLHMSRETYGVNNYQVKFNEDSTFENESGEINSLISYNLWEEDYWKNKPVWKRRIKLVKIDDK